MTKHSPAEMLEESYTSAQNFFGEMSRTTFVADYIFNFTTYDTEKSDEFGGRALEVCAAISTRGTFDYIKDGENYRWFLLMVNMPFFADRLDWGTSIRGAWWATPQPPIQSDCLWLDGRQIINGLPFAGNEWESFITALLQFAAKEKPDGIQT